MKAEEIHPDPAFAAMTMDILDNVLSRSDNPGDLGEYVTEEIRELTGARCMVLIQCLGTSMPPAHRVVSVNPPRMRGWAESADAILLYGAVHRTQTAQFWRGDEPAEAAGLLQREGFALSMVLPLNAGEFRVGAMVLLGLPDEAHISSVLGLLNNLSSIVALVLRNSFLFEHQEQTIRERTAALQDVNEQMQAELGKRRQAQEDLQEQAAILEEEIEERRRAEEAIRILNEQLEQRVQERTAELEVKNAELRIEMASRFRQQQFLEALLESTEAGIVACDADGILTLFNRKSREFHGLPQTPIPADQWAEHYDLFLPDGKTSMRTEDVPLFRALQGERVVNDEMMIIPRGGEAKILLASGQPIHDKDGRKIGAVVAMHDITERKRMEETLRVSEEKYRSVVENIGIGVTLISPDMEILAQNACMQTWFPQVDVSRRPICYESFINPPRADLCANCPTIRTLHDGQVHEAIIETPSGERTLFFRVLSSPIRDKDGNVIAATELVEDVTRRQAVEEELRQYRERLEELIKERTMELEKANRLLHSELAERKRAEEAIRSSEEKFARAFHASPNLMAITTPEDGRIVEINEAYCRALGLSSEECVGHTTAELRIWADSQQREQIIRQIREEGMARDVEVDLRRKSGETCSVVLSMEGITINGKEYLLSVATDITERKRAEGALGKSEARFRRLAENARDVIYRMSLPDGAYEYMSPAVTELFGYAPEEFYTSPGLIREIIHPDWHAYFEEEWAKLLQGEMPPMYEFQLIHKSGDVRWVNQRNILVRDDAGRIVAIEGIITDITARKSSEEELQRMNEELEQRVAERTAELARKNDELERMNKLFVGRELRMMELKERIGTLEQALQGGNDFPKL